MHDMGAELRAELKLATTEAVHQSEARLIHRMDAGFHEVKSELHRVALLVEDQNAKNRYVLDGYTQLYEIIMQKFQA